MCGPQSDHGEALRSPYAGSIAAGMGRKDMEVRQLDAGHTFHNWLQMEVGAEASNQVMSCSFLEQHQFFPLHAWIIPSHFLRVPLHASHHDEDNLDSALDQETAKILRLKLIFL